MTAVSASLTLVSSSIRAEKNSESQITAGNLAREGVEVVRAIRDSNWLAGRSFDAGLTGASRDYSGVPVFDPAANSWSIDFTPDAITSDWARVSRYVAASGNAVIGLMVQGATVPVGAVISPYRRLVSVDPLCDNGTGSYAIVTSGSDCGANLKVGIRVTSTVQWATGGAAKTMSVEERMFDWR